MGELDPALQRDLLVTALRDVPAIAVLAWLYLRQLRRIDALVAEVADLSARVGALADEIYHATDGTWREAKRAIAESLLVRPRGAPEPVDDEPTGRQH